jgi:hypothetical protein
LNYGKITDFGFAHGTGPIQSMRHHIVHPTFHVTFNEVGEVLGNYQRKTMHLQY